ncbi:hypothetical protein LCGC14_2355070 [marine sediment metagenome]|uniref:Uncharacterized protein n=1 Tax=marine sediment metagenome TaxID=412755 RepID=A0A0F9EKT3_9ZZZZ
MTTIFFPHRDRFVSGYFWVIADLAIYWSYSATVSAKPIDVVMNSAKKNGGRVIS